MRDWDEDDLWIAVRDGNQAAREEVVRRYFDLLHRSAATMVRGLPSHVDVADLVSYGSLGLLKAVDRYGALPDDDPNRGPGKFRKYAVISIYSRILDELRALDWAPKAFRRKVKDVDRAREELRGHGLDEPTVEEVADHLDWDADQVRIVDLSVRQFSLVSIDEEPLGLEEAPARQLPDESLGTEELAALGEVQSRVVRWLDSLPLDHQRIVARCYFEGKTLRAVAAEMQMPAGVVTSIHSQLMVDLREFVLEEMGLHQP